MTAQKHLTLTTHGDVGVITINAPDQKLNMATSAMLAELDALRKLIHDDKGIKSVVIFSGKENNFIAGADINELSHFSSKKVAQRAVSKAQALYNAIENSHKPYIAAIHGACMGGGLELALACHARIASLDPKTAFALPEVSLGFLPAAGGTQRLPRLIGLTNALPLLLLGKRLGGTDAKKLGLVDEAVHQREELLPFALAYARTAIARKFVNRRHMLFPWSLAPLFIAKRRVLKETRGHYPAPLAIIDALFVGIMRGINAGFKEEAVQFGSLVHTAVSKNLVKLFFASKARQKNPYEVASVKNIGIVGSGLMGTGIASVSLLKNYDVHLSDTSPDALAKAQATIWRELSTQSRRRRITTFDQNRLMANLSVDQDLSHIKQCDVVIEAIVEDLEAKRALLSKVELLMKPTCIFATNTSSLPIAEIGAQSTIKDRIVGMHYFSPVQKMPLLEIVKSPHTSEETLAIACEVGVRQGKSIIIVADSPGFYTTRIIAALFDEASLLLLEGVSPHVIDELLMRLGFPIGPITLMDEVGLDIALHVSETLHAHFGSRLINANLSLCKSMIEQGFLGRKTGRGFYVYNAHRKRVNRDFVTLLRKLTKPLKAPTEAIEERMLMRLINEAAFCRAEGVLHNEEDGDVGAVLGLGFPPYLGGPFSYIKNQGVKNIASSLKRLYEQFGERFTKAPYFSA